MKQQAPAIQIVFVDKDGTTKNGPLTTPPTKARKAHGLDDGNWSKEQTVQRFRQFLKSGDDNCLKAVMRALDRHDCWGDALGNLKQGQSPNAKMGDALLSFWFTYGLYSVPRALREDLPHLIDAFHYLLPPYVGQGLTLYRGELASRHRMKVYGIAWTPMLSVAEMFAARRLPDEGQGVVLKLDATPDMIVAKVRDHSEHTLRLGEDEYLVDPRKIQGRVSVVS